MTENCRKECILGAETSPPGLADASHHQQPEIFCNRDREPVDDITDIRVECEEPAGRYTRAGTGFFLQVLHALRYRHNLSSIQRWNSQSHCKVLLGVPVNGKDSEPLLCKEVGKDGSQCSLTHPAFTGDYYPDSAPGLSRKGSFFW